MNLFVPMKFRKKKKKIFIGCGVGDEKRRFLV
jgi:hypothetical protein